MERTLNRERTFSKAILPALMLAALAFSMVVIMYGADSILPMVHDTFHDFRHVIGMPCH